MTAQFQPGDRVGSRFSVNEGVVTAAADTTGRPEVEWVDGNKGRSRPQSLRHVPVTAEHVGQWARNGRDADGSVGIVTKVDRDWVTLAAPGGEAIAVVKPWAVVVITDPSERPVPVAPAPDQDDEPEALVWRQAAMAGGALSPVLAWVERPNGEIAGHVSFSGVDAALAVSRVNAHAALTARAEHAEAEVKRLRERGAERAREWDVEYREVCTERDAARAELAAAGTTDLPTVTRVDEHTLRIGQVEYLASGPAALRRRIAVHHLALAAFLDEETARLAQEAPTTKDDDRG